MMKNRNEATDACMYENLLVFKRWIPVGLSLASTVANLDIQWLLWLTSMMCLGLIALFLLTTLYKQSCCQNCSLLVLSLSPFVFLWLQLVLGSLRPLAHA